MEFEMMVLEITSEYVSWLRCLLEDMEYIDTNCIDPLQ